MEIAQEAIIRRINFIDFVIQYMRTTIGHSSTLHLRSTLKLLHIKNVVASVPNLLLQKSEL